MRKERKKKVDPAIRTSSPGISPSLDHQIGDLAQSELFPVAINPKKFPGTLLCHVINHSEGLLCDVPCSFIYKSRKKEKGLGERKREGRKEERKGGRKEREEILINKIRK